MMFTRYYSINGCFITSVGIHPFFFQGVLPYIHFRGEGNNIYGNAKNLILKNTRLAPSEAKKRKLTTPSKTCPNKSAQG